MTIYLGLGSNLGDRERNLRAAIALLNDAAIRVTRESSIYETEPLEYTDQPWFLNMVVEAETDLAPLDLHARTWPIENELGRVREIPKGPRAIDVDILLYGDRIVREPTLEIPHPGIAARRFVLAPLADLAPGLRHPVTGRTVREMLADAPPEAVRLLHS